MNPKKALLPAPTFAEYEQALVSVGCEISRYYLKEENDFCIQKDYPDVLKREKPDIIFLCNPNNPTGITIPQDLLEEILETCAMQGIFMVVDECFLDFVKDSEKHTLKGKLDKYPGLFILKAFTKRYAIPVCVWAMDSVRTGKYLTGWRQSPSLECVYYGTAGRNGSTEGIRICGSRTADHFQGICMDEGKDETAWADGISF